MVWTCQQGVGGLGLDLNYPHPHDGLVHQERHRDTVHLLAVH